MTAMKARAIASSSRERPAQALPRRGAASPESSLGNRRLKDVVQRSSGSTGGSSLSRWVAPSNHAPPEPAPPRGPHEPRLRLAAVSHRVQRLCSRCEDDDSCREPRVQRLALPGVRVGLNDDPLEREAEHFATRLFGTAATTAPEVPANDPPMTPAPSPTSSRLASGGQPLPAFVRSFFERCAGADLGDVRVHLGPASARLNRELDAEAFTYANHVWLSSDEQLGANRTMAHELAHVVQQTAPARLARSPLLTAAPRGVQRRRPRTQGDDRSLALWQLTAMVRFANAMQELEERNPPLARLLRQIDAAFRSAALTRARAIEAPLDVWVTRMVATEFEPTTILGWLRTLIRGLNSLSSRWRAEAPLLNQLIDRAFADPVVRTAAEIDRANAQVRRARASRRALRGTVRRFLRRRMADLRATPSLVWVEMRESLLLPELHDDRGITGYITELRSSDRPLSDLLRLLRDRPHSLRSSESEAQRFLALAFLGEWADEVASPQHLRQTEAARLTGAGETSVETEVAGTAVDTAITLIPFVDQLADLRDLSAHVFALGNFSGNRPREYRSAMRWISVVLTLVGLVPEVGSALRGVGNMIRRVSVRLSGAVAPVVQRLLDPVGRFIRTYTPHALPFVEGLLVRIRSGWDSIAGTVRRRWHEASATVSRWLDNALVRVTPIGQRVRRTWAQVQEAADPAIQAALNRLKRYWEPLFEALSRALRPAQRAIAETAQAARRRWAAARDALRSPDARLRRADEALGGADQASAAARAADRDGAERVAEGGPAPSGRRSEPMAHETAPSRPVLQAPELTPRQRELLRESNTMDSVSGPHLDNELEVLSGSTGWQRSTHPDYATELVLGNHTWRRRSDGTVCRFSPDPPSLCVPRSAAVETRPTRRGHVQRERPLSSGNRGVRVENPGGGAGSLILAADGTVLSYTGRIVRGDLGRHGARTGTHTTISARRRVRQLGRETDDAGHVLARIFGGIGGSSGRMVIPLSPTLNRVWMRNFEMDLAALVESSANIRAINYRVRAVYRPGDTRPYGVRLTVWVNGQYYRGGLFPNR